MDKRRIVAWIIVAVVFVVAFIWLVGTFDEETVLSGARLTVATTIFPLADIVKNVAGEDVHVVQVVPPGASPHSYSITPAQVIDLQQAEVVFHIGQGSDDAVIDSITKALGSGSQAVAVHNGIVLRPFDGSASEDHSHSDVDPHYWLSVPNAKKMAENVVTSLSVIDPAAAVRYEENLVVYLAELDELEGELQESASKFDQRNFVTIHNAWSYFAEQYGLDLVGVYEAQEGQEPSPRGIQELRQLVIDHNIKVFYTEPQKVSTPAASFFRNLGLEIGVLDPIGGLPGRETYINMMRANMAALADI